VEQNGWTARSPYRGRSSAPFVRPPRCRPPGRRTAWPSPRPFRANLHEASAG
jgi:hypothetical protein